MIEEVSNYLNEVRREFSKAKLTEESVKERPMEQYAVWFEEAVGAQVLDPEAMCLSTVSADGKPTSRIVYARGISESGFVFYTNYESKKAADIKSNPHVCLNIHWGELERQIRVTGKAEKVSSKLSDEYFAGRPRDSQIGAWAGKQSEKIASREELEKKVAHFKKKFEGKEVPRPPFWGGYLIKPEYFEFWQGRPGRVHDRIAFALSKAGKWETFRLSP